MKTKSILFILFFSLSQILPAESRKNCITVAVFSINDFHGGFVQNVKQGIPGAPSILQTLDSLKKVYPYNVTIAAGDNFGGSFFYNAVKGIILPPFFKAMDICISELGNHEFDDGQTSLAKKWKDDPIRPKNWNFKYICANICNAKHEYPSYVQPYNIQTIKISSTKEIRVGFVGLITSSTPIQTRAKNVQGLYFKGKYNKVLDSLKTIPSFKNFEKANLRFLVVHIGTRMKNGHPVWDDKDEKYLYSIHDSLYQGIFSAHSHAPVCGYINSAKYPVVQGWWHGKYIGIMKCIIDTLNMKVMSVIPEIYKVPYIPVKQLKGRALVLQQQIDSLLSHTRTKGGTPIGEILTVATQNMPHDRMNKQRQSEVGTLVCSSYAEAFRKAAHLSNSQPVIGCSHFGSIRGGFTKGKVSVLEVGEVLPFSNSLRVFKITGKQIKKLIDFGYHDCRYGWIQTAHLLPVLNKKKYVEKLYYISPEGKKYLMKDNIKYYIVADSFMTTGGDGYPVKFFLSKDEVHSKLPATTDAFIQYLKTLSYIPNSIK